MSVESLARRIRIVCVLAVCATALLIVSGCKDDRPVTLVPDKVNEVNLGDTFQIVVDENRTTQYRWYLDLSGDDIIDVVSDDFSLDSKNRDADGAGGERTITFRATAPGEATIEMYFIKELPEPFDENHKGDASQTVNYQITVE